MAKEGERSLFCPPWQPSPSLSLNTDCFTPGRLEMAPVQGRNEHVKASPWGDCALDPHIEGKQLM